MSRPAAPLRALTLDDVDRLTVDVDPDVEVPDCSGSLCDLAVVRWLLDEANFRLASRCIDMRWGYDQVFEASLNPGFDPFGECIFVPRVSSMNVWLADPRRKDLGRLNLDNRLIGEVFFAIHDLFHMWAYRWIMNHPREFELGAVPIDERSLDDYAFCHLLSEATATVGLDYWYLSQMSLDDELGLPLAFHGLTVSYHHRMDEVLASQTDLTVYCPEFFARVCRLYTTGELPDIARDVMVRSPDIATWLRHELTYSVTQRLYTCAWFSFLAGLPEPSRERCLRPLSCDVPWRRRLIEELGDALWRMTRDQRYALAPHVPASALPHPGSRPADPRFVNPARFALIDDATDDRDLYRRHKAATYDYRSFSPAQRAELARAGSLAAFHRVLVAGEPLEPHDEPWLLFQLG